VGHPLMTAMSERRGRGGALLFRGGSGRAGFEGIWALTSGKQSAVGNCGGSCGREAVRRPERPEEQGMGIEE